MLPIKTLTTINRPTKERFILVIIFGIGLFAAVMSVVRLQSIYKFTLSTDPFRDSIAVCTSLGYVAHPRKLLVFELEPR